MSLYSLVHSVFGEYVFKTDPKSFARLASMLMQRKIHFWGSRVNEEAVCFHASLFSAEAVNKTAKEAGIALELCERRGLPFIFSRYRRRYGMFVGAAVFMLLMLFSQLFVWDIEISGNSTLTTHEIERALEGVGVSVGSFIPNIDRLGKANELLMECHELSSVSISINGTHVSVAVLERVSVPELISQQGYYNVVAEYDGIVLDIDAADGTPEVREGEAVFKGELLINSFMEGRNGSFIPTHARGVVYAAVKESFVAEIPLKRITKVYTGKSETKKVYRVLGHELPSLSGLGTEYEYFDSVASERDIVLFGFIALPVREYRVTYSEYTPLYVDIDESEAEILANEQLADYLAELDLEVLECESVFASDKEKGVCVLKAEAFVKRDIAREVPFELINYKISERFESESE